MYGCLRLTKTKLVILTIMLIMSVMAAVVFNGEKAQSVNASLNKNRVEFITSLGLKVDEHNYSVKSVIIPVNFSDVYENYNQLQKTAGYDLKKYAGKQVTQYTYCVDGSKTHKVNLLVYKQKIIGGDISSVALDGNMQALLPQNDG